MKDLHKEEHREAINYLSIHPKVLGLDNIALSIMEANLFRKDGRLYHQPDLIYIGWDGNIYQVEYKSNGAHRVRALLQLREQEEAMHNIPPFKASEIASFFVREKYVVERIKPRI